MPSLHPNKNALRFVARSSDKTRPVIPVRVLRSAFNVGDRVSVSRARVPQPITRPSPTRLLTRLPALAVARCSLNRAQPTRFITVDHQKRRVYYGHRVRFEDVCRSVPPTSDPPPRRSNWTNPNRAQTGGFYFFTAALSALNTS